MLGNGMPSNSDRDSALESRVNFSFYGYPLTLERAGGPGLGFGLTGSVTCLSTI